jgi:hypothetical protein
MTPILSRRIKSDTGSKLIITIPNHTQGIHFPILIYWLMGWTFGELATINEINRQGLNKSNVFFLAWAILWTVIGTGTLFDLLWQLGSRQTLAIEHTFLTHRHGLLGLHWVKRYELTCVDNVRTVLPRKSGVYGRTIAFDYDGKPIQLGPNMDEIEAKQLVTIIRKYTQTSRYPERKRSVPEVTVT